MRKLSQCWHRHELTDFAKLSFGTDFSSGSIHFPVDLRPILAVGGDDRQLLD